MTRTYSRDDVQTHGDRPAVNVKVYRSMQDAWASFEKEESPDPRYTLEWIEQHVSDDSLDAVFWIVAESEFDYLRDWATGADGDGLFPNDRVTLNREGRSAGWVTVDGLPEIEDWDAVRLARWRKFERIAREIADSVPHQMLASLYLNDFEAWSDEQDDRASYNAEVPVDLAGAV